MGKMRIINWLLAGLFFSSSNVEKQTQSKTLDVVTGSQNVTVTQVRFQTNGRASTDSLLDAGIGKLPEMTQFTVCSRFFLEQAAKGIDIILSYFYEEGSNELSLGIQWSSKEIQLVCCNGHIILIEQIPLMIRSWHHTCVAVNLESSQYWMTFDDIYKTGASAVRKESLKVAAEGRLVIGQELDSLQGDFDIAQSFYGSIVDFQLFSKALDSSQLKNYVTCQSQTINLEPILSFRENMSDFEVRGYTTVDDIPLANLCLQKPQYEILIFPEMKNFKESKLLCSKLKGFLALPTHEIENEQLWNEALRFHELCQGIAGKLYWIGAVGDPATGRWYKLTDNSEIKWNGAIHTRYELTHTSERNCMSVYKGYSQKWFPTNCDSQACVFCNISSTVVLTVRGHCKTTLVDRSLQLNGYKNLKPVFKGIHHTVISWNNKLSTWIMTDRIHEDFLGSLVMDTINKDLIGTKTWRFTGDLCSANQTQLKITACDQSTEFTCNDGKCIAMSKRCNSISDCDDKSDEIECNLIILHEDLNGLHSPPPLKRRNDSFHIHVYADITSVRKIDILGFKIILDIKTYLRWRDSRIQFANLKTHREYNMVYQNTSLWYPALKIRDSSEAIADVINRFESLTIEREGDPIPDDLSRLSEDEIYQGSENTLVLSKEDTIGFACQFELQKYPFDRQTCSITLSMFKVPDYVKLMQSLDGVVFSGQRKLLEYKVTVVKMENIIHGVQGQKVTIVLENLFGYYISSTYVPTILLVLICYMTLFFDLDNFSDRVMVSLTSLLVLAALFTQTSQTIPKTSYLKLIDLWYVCIIVMVFIIIVIIVAIESLRLKGQRQKRLNKVHMISNKTENYILGKMDEDPELESLVNKTSSSLNFVAIILLPFVVLIFLGAYINACLI